jgi:uncharacterized protein (UPF0303 family)
MALTIEQLKALPDTEGPRPPKYYRTDRVRLRLPDGAEPGDVNEEGVIQAVDWSGSDETGDYSYLVEVLSTFIDLDANDDGLREVGESDIECELE